jgi:hypothetical protein
MANLEALLEAERRGILPADKAPLLEEARSRGLIPGGEQAAQSPPPMSFFDRVKDVLSSGVAASGAESDMAVAPAQYLNMDNFGRPVADAAMTSLPVVGATAGGVLGANPLTLTALGPFGPVGGAAIGGAAGKSAENFLRNITGIGTPTDAVTGPLKTGAEMGAWEMGGGGLLNLLSRIASPVARAFSENTVGQGLKNFAEKNDLPFSASTIQPSKMADAAETFVNLFPSGKYVTTKYQADLYKKFLNTRSNVLGELTGNTATMEGRTIQEGIKETKAALKEARDTTYSEIVPAAGGKGQVIELPQTRELIDNILDQPRVIKNDKLSSVLDKFNTESVQGLTADKLDKFQRQIWTLTKNDLSLGADIWKALETDIKAFDESAGKALMDAINSAKGAAKNQIKYDFMSGIFNKSSTIRQGEEVFQPDKFYSIIMNAKNQQYIKQQFGDDVLKNLQDYAEFARKVSMESSKRTMSDMQKIWQSAMTLGGGAGTVMSSPAIAVPYGMSYAMAHMIMKPRGVFKKWLTEGFTIPEGAKETLKVGGRAAIAGENE